MHHRLAKILCAGLASAMAKDDVVSGSIVPYRIGVVDGDVVGALIELAHGIAACIHNLGDEPVRFVHCAFGIVDEPPLDDGPLLRISVSLGLRQGSKFKMGDTFFSFGENGFSALRISVLVHDAVVF